MAKSTTKEEEYAALIKPGDAVETPDGELWVVTDVGEERLALVSAYRDRDSRPRTDVFSTTKTTIPKGMATKVADVRQVRRGDAA